MPPFVLTVLKIVFLAMLYFFVWRAIRATLVDVRDGTVAARGPRQAGRPEPTARPSGKAPRSVVVVDDKGSKIGTHSLADGQLQIGRADACQVQLSDNYASQFHARIFRRDGSWFVEDLGSTNGTYLNQRRLTAPSELRAGDRLKIGKTTLELRR